MKKIYICIMKNLKIQFKPCNYKKKTWIQVVNNKYYKMKKQWIIIHKKGL